MPSCSMGLKLLEGKLSWSVIAEEQWKAHAFTPHTLDEKIKEFEMNLKNV